MNSFDDYFSADEILRQICKTRARYSKRLNKKHLLHLLSGKKELQYHLNDPQNRKNPVYDEIRFLQTILPPRRKWVNLSARKRIDKYGQKINSMKLAERTLLATVDRFRHNNPDEPFLKELDKFILEIQNTFTSGERIIHCPDVIALFDKPTDQRSRCNPESQTPSKSKCRPVSQFPLKEKIIISITNKYLTEKLDPFFLKNSYAFRSKNTLKERPGLQHHYAVKELIEHCAKNGSNEWYVAECDIKKFFDSVNHTVVRIHFKALVARTNRIHKDGKVDPRAIRVFNEYLDCYNYYGDVLPLNKVEDYWKQFDRKQTGTRFKDIRIDLMDCGFYKRVNHSSRFGIPQGGALSGLIANIVLHNADKKVLKNSDGRLGYFRYCDDIIILHPEITITDQAITSYQEALRELKLVCHPPTDMDVQNKKKFWDEKSKSTYRWGPGHHEGMEWIGFVGYEISYDFRVRARKKSLDKEIHKQDSEVNKIILAVKNKTEKRKSNDAVMESAVHRLIGISVGRVELYNYQTVHPDMCWARGFLKLSDNPYTRGQLKILDNNRRKNLLRLRWALKKSPDASSWKRYTVRKWEFTRVKGISRKTSEAIRNFLKQEGILGKNFSFTLGKSSEEYLKIALPPEFEPYRKGIITVLNNLSGKREVGYYGKPFSYYYQVLKQKNNISEKF